MSLKLTTAAVSPSTVYTGAQFIISVTVYDDAFEFAEYDAVYDEHQGFADIEQTIGGKLQQLPGETTSGLVDSNGVRIKDSDGNYIVFNTGAEYRLSYTAEQINNFITEVVSDG